MSGFTAAVLTAVLLAASSGGALQRSGKAAQFGAEAERGTPSRAAGMSAAPAARRHVEQLAAIVARRYRVSGEATREFVEAALREARRHELDPLLILALIAVESRFNPVAQSQYGAMGLMQVIPRFHREKLDGARDAVLLDPRTNIQLGTRVLKEYIRRGGTEVAGLQLYNGAAADPSNAYANRVIDERERLRQAVKRARDDRA